MTSAITRVQREVVLARFLGKLAVDQGLAELRQRVDSIRAQLVEPAPDEPAPGASPAEAPPRGHGRVESAVPAARGPVEAADGADELALADYDSLPAAAIVAKLDGLEPDELDAIETYERNGRGRRTILGRIRQLREDAP